MTVFGTVAWHMPDARQFTSAISVSEPLNDVLSLFRPRFSLLFSVVYLLLGTPPTMDPHWPFLMLLLFSLGAFGSSSTSSSSTPNTALDLTRILGKGAFSTVFKAHLRGTRMQFAVKIPISDTDKHQTIFENELNVLQTLFTNLNDADQRFLGLLSSGFQHSQYFNFSLAHNIRQHYAQTLSGRTTKALVFPLYEGKDLHSLLAKVASGQVPPLTAWEVYSLALGIVRALQALHGAGYVHRDLKPANVMLDTSRPIPGSDIGQPVLIDFGFAQEIGVEAHRSGSRGYVAPELRLPCMCSSALDVFSFGSVFKQLKLQSISHPNDLRTMQNESWHQKPADHGLASRCWNRDPAKRPTLDEIAQDFEEFLQEYEYFGSE